MRGRTRLLPAMLCASLLTAAVPAVAIEPDELLPDARLEARARAISADLRCLVCQNQSIDESNAPLARDLRNLVRSRLTAGDSDAAVRTYVVDRYGEFVLLRPVFAPHTLLLWFGPPVLLGLGAVALLLRRRRPAPGPEAAGLTPEERARLRTMLGPEGA